MNRTYYSPTSKLTPSFSPKDNTLQWIALSGMIGILCATVVFFILQKHQSMTQQLVSYDAHKKWANNEISRLKAQQAYMMRHVLGLSSIQTVDSPHPIHQQNMENGKATFWSLPDE